MEKEKKKVVEIVFSILSKNNRPVLNYWKEKEKEDDNIYIFVETKKKAQVNKNLDYTIIIHKVGLNDLCNTHKFRARRFHFSRGQFNPPPISPNILIQSR